MPQDRSKYTSQEVKKFVQQAQKNLLGNITYELLTPLTTIRSLAEALQDDIVKAEQDQHVYYKKIVLETQITEQMVADLIELSKLQSNCLSFQKTPVRTIDIFGPVFERFFMRSANTEITLDIEQFDLKNIPLLYTEADRLVRLLNILLDNSARLAGQKGTVCFTYEINSTFITFCIRNNGFISEKNIKSMFNGLYKANSGCISSINRIEFAIAEQIAGGLNEKLWAESSEDNGTAFYFTVTF